MPGRSVRVAELLCVLSLCSDLGMGQPMDHGYRACLLATRLAEAMGLEPADRNDVYQLALLRWVGCTAHAHELSAWFEDEIAAHGRLLDLDTASVPQMAGDLLRYAGAGRPPLARARALGNALGTAARRVPEMFRASCEVAEGLCPPLAVPSTVAVGLRFVFERWDGRGVPEGCRGEEIPLAVRVVQMAHLAAAHGRAGGPAAAVAAVRRRAGRELDPRLVEVLADLGAAAFPEDVAVRAVLEAEPLAGRRLEGRALDDAFAAVADFADLKSPWLSGHSRAVGRYSALAADAAGMDAHRLRWAGYCHDIGRTAVPTAVWDRPGRLAEGEMERVRLHPYWTERVLARAPSLADLARLAGAHHERLDGSGYPRATPADQLPVGSRVLAAADVYASLLADRPHRPARTAPEAQAVLRKLARNGGLDGSAVEAVLSVAGAGRPRRRPSLPFGLTVREAEVLGLLARGMTNRRMAARLHLSERTVAHHVEHAYAKLGVTTRAAATLLAMRHGLVNESGAEDGPDGP